MTLFEPAVEADMNFIRRAWMQDVRDPVDIRLGIRNAVLETSTVLVLRPPEAPPDTVGAFIVMGDGLVSWYGVKRAWRGLGFGLMCIAEAESAFPAVRFARYATQEQKRFLERRGWVYSPRSEVLLAG